MKEGGKDRLGFTLPTDHMQIACKAGTAAAEEAGCFALNTCDLGHVSDTVTDLEEQNP